MKGGERQPRCPERDVSRACTHKFAMSALPPKADIRQRERRVRFVPKADIGLLVSIIQISELFGS
jgi:hypothetical protein